MTTPLPKIVDSVPMCSGEECPMWHGSDTKPLWSHLDPEKQLGWVTTRIAGCGVDDTAECEGEPCLPSIRAMAARLAMLEAAQKCNECDNNPCMCEAVDQVFADKEPGDV